MKTFSYTNRFHTEIFVSSADNFVMCALRRILVKGLSSYFRKWCYSKFHLDDIDQKLEERFPHMEYARLYEEIIIPIRKISF